MVRYSHTNLTFAEGVRERFTFAEGVALAAKRCRFLVVALAYFEGELEEPPFQLGRVVA